MKLKLVMAALIFNVVGSLAATEPPKRLTIYSGRSEALIGPLIERFEQSTGIEVLVSYQGTAQLASQILAEGAASPADVLLAQDVGYLSLLGRRGVLRTLQTMELPEVGAAFRSPEGWWVGTSGRARVLVLSPDRVPVDSRPRSLSDLADAGWSGRLGWAPGNASFQAHVSVLRHVWGEEATRAWLQKIITHKPLSYPKNSPQVKAVATGEIDVGWVNHYYLHKLKAQVGERAINYSFPAAGDAGNILMPSGVGILRTAKADWEAESFLRFLLSDEAQKYFAEEVYEYPAREGIATHPDVPSLKSLGLASFDPQHLTDLEGTLAMLRNLGLL